MCVNVALIWVWLASATFDLLISYFLVGGKLKAFLAGFTLLGRLFFVDLHKTEAMKMKVTGSETENPVLLKGFN